MNRTNLIYAVRGLGALLVLVSVYMLISNYRNISPENRDTSNLQKINAIVVDKNIREEPLSPDSTEKRTLYAVRMEYQFDVGAQKFYKERMVDKSYYDKVFKGDILTIYANRANPSQVVIPDSRSTPVSLFNSRLLLALVLLAAGVAALIFAPRVVPASME